MKKVIRNFLMLSFSIVVAITAFPINTNASSHSHRHSYLITYDGNLEIISENISLEDLRNINIDARFITCPICRNGWFSQQETATAWRNTGATRVMGNMPPNIWAEFEQVRTIISHIGCDTCGHSGPVNTRDEFRWIRA